MRDLQVADLDEASIQGEIMLRRHQLDLQSNITVLATGDLEAHTALSTARAQSMLASAVAQGLMPGIGVGMQRASNGRAASAFVWGAPVTLANGRAVPFFCGTQRLHRGVTARFDVRDGKVWLDYSE